MLHEYECERIRRASSLEKKSLCRIAKDEGYSHQAFEKALFNPLPKPYYLSHPRSAPIVDPYQPRVETLLRQMSRCLVNSSTPHAKPSRLYRKRATRGEAVKIVFDRTGKRGRPRQEVRVLTVFGTITCLHRVSACWAWKALTRKEVSSRRLGRHGDSLWYPYPGPPRLR